MSLKKIQHNARYNNFIRELAENTEEAVTDLHVFIRLLAMETDYKDWVAKQMEENPNAHTPFLSEAMLSLAEDGQVQTLLDLREDLEDLLSYLSSYMLDTDEMKVEYN